MLLRGPACGVKAHVVSPRRPTSRYHTTVASSRRGVAVKARLQDTDAVVSRRDAGLLAAALTLVEVVPACAFSLPAMAAGEPSFYDFTVMQRGEPFALVSTEVAIGRMPVGSGGTTRSGSAVWLWVLRAHRPHRPLVGVEMPLPLNPGQVRVLRRYTRRRYSPAVW